MTEDIDLIVHIPLEVEFTAFLESFEPVENITSGVFLCYRVKAPSKLKVVVIKQEKMGRAAASAASRHILSRFRPKLYVCLGIAGGLSNDLKIGDVCYTGCLIDVYDNSKVTDAEEGEGVNIDFEPEYYYGNRQITAAIGFIRTMPELKALKEYWEEAQGGFAAVEAPNGLRDTDGNVEQIGSPTSLNGFIICGSVSQSDKYKARLKGVTRSPLGIETESGPVFEECAEMGILAVSIRGISDYADPSKKKLEAGSKEVGRKIAAHNAVTFLHAQLQNDVLLARLPRSEPDIPELPLQDVTLNGLPGLLEKAASEIDRKLRELSPQYRTKPIGYRLPSPRVRSTSDVSSDATQPRMLEFLKAVSAYDRMIVSFPRTYPDPALAWALANSILSYDLDKRKIIPVVIDGTAIAPPRAGIKALSPFEVDPSYEEAGAVFVFIIDSLNLTSKTRTEFAAAQMAEWPNAKFVFLISEDKAFVERIESRKLLSLNEFRVCDVSFSEIATFLEASFEMPGREAEVVALALRNAFQRFSLPAHPSFFAGIPSESLSALLLANRRSELVQLAVDGALSFVVASDKSSVRLSRTTRTAFLRSIVVQQKLEKRTLSETNLVQIAQELSDEFDYGINAIDFIGGFIESGIIYVDNGIASITLPFVESYLLASELSRNPQLAQTYFFGFPNDDFDFLTFDLYSELGPAPEVLNRVSSDLEVAIASFDPPADQNILLTGRLDPVMLRAPARLAALGSRVTEARKALESGASHRDEKVRILDIAERVSEDVAEQHENKEEAKGSNSRPIDALSQSWTIGTVLLGSGAESLNGVDRQSLAEKVLSGADLITHLWTTEGNNLDFEAIKQEVIADRKFQEKLEISTDEEYKHLVNSLVDFVEYLTMTMPIINVSSQLMNGVKNGVIGISLAKVAGNTIIQRLIRSLWLTAIDPGEGQPALQASIKELPFARVLRTALVSLLIHRAKWLTTKESTQYLLIDAAEAIVKPVNQSLDKGELLRFVEKKNEQRRLSLPDEQD